MSFSTQDGNLVFAVSFAAHFRSFLIIMPVPLGEDSPVQTSRSVFDWFFLPFGCSVVNLEVVATS